MQLTGLQQVQIPHCPDATHLDVFCLESSEGLISHRAYSWLELQQAGASSQVDAHRFVEDVAAGEREVVEFKPFIRKDHQKGRELVRAIVAFSNTSGGRVYVGIKDDGQPEGRDALRPFQSSQDHDGRPTQIAQLRKLIQDSVKPVPQPAYFSCEIDGQPVVVVEVPAGDFVCSTHENDIYIRKGSTNRKPDPITELPRLLARSGASASLSSDDIV